MISENPWYVMYGPRRVLRTPSGKSARTIDYFKSTMSDVDVQQVLLCGGGAQVKGLVPQLSDRMQAIVEVANPFGEIDTSGSGFDQNELTEMAPLAAVGVGLALRSVGDR